MEDSRGISFVDDMTWLVEGAELNDVVNKLERCMAASLQWANNNAVRFETSKTEAILFSKRRKHHRNRCDRTIRVGGQSVSFAPAATWWLGILLDSSLSLARTKSDGLQRPARPRQGCAGSSTNTVYHLQQHATF